MLLRKSKKIRKNNDIAREIMFCTWPQITIKRLFLQLIQKKLTSLDKFPPLNYYKTLSPPFLFSLLKFQKKFLPLNESNDWTFYIWFLQWSLQCMIVRMFLVHPEESHVWRDTVNIDSRLTLQVSSTKLLFVFSYIVSVFTTSAILGKTCYYFSDVAIKLDHSCLIIRIIFEINDLVLTLYLFDK